MGCSQSWHVWPPCGIGKGADSSDDEKVNKKSISGGKFKLLRANSFTKISPPSPSHSVVVASPPSTRSQVESRDLGQPPSVRNSDQDNVEGDSGHPHNTPVMVLPRKLSLRASLSLAPEPPPPTMFNKRDLDYPHKEQFDFLGIYFVNDVLKFFDAYKRIVVAEKVQSIEDMVLESDGIGAREILLDQMKNQSCDSKHSGPPATVRSILKYFHQKDNKFLQLVFTLHCDEMKARDGKTRKGELSFKLFVIVLWNFCTQNANTFAEFAFGLYDTLHSGALPTAKFDRMMKEMYGSHYVKSRYAKRSNSRMQKLGGSCVGLFMFKEYCKSNPRVMDPLFRYQRLLRKALKIDPKQWQSMTERRLAFTDKRGRSLDVYEITQAMAEETGCPGDAIYEKRFEYVRQYTDSTVFEARKEAHESEMRAEKFCEALVLNVEDVVFYDGKGYESSKKVLTAAEEMEDPVILELKKKNPNDLSLDQLKMLVRPPKVRPVGCKMGFGLHNNKYDLDNEVKILDKYVQISFYSRNGKSGYVHNNPLGQHCCNNKMSRTKEKALALVLRNHPQTWRDEVLLYHSY
mmetsp:Transcript_1523/g.2866  ORF Transcript_1523/g.2866 Transcript_1523/m.2866 type:complete len:573 (-) Transcript_1523:390-2108(-)|eukprot:CAMPEP_0114423472 /NCGR_PEP_ID=MMETSP0103-20121206/6166_1 /TAXON_ID=37642 ORGANISM="Paraphysomonas imperforata, Strain PA2" /NCGR_SAMPLE_ID=MMETSP0103 /ASSEMBLY_ACC=CAM_ASM_000201 /LENGTH=572 /DNA_ID=CAMNT_0001592135 /DNA_START=79 /DNA_END=1797 /DNA_ORIENTATION=-